MTRAVPVALILCERVVYDGDRVRQIVKKVDEIRPVAYPHVEPMLTVYLEVVRRSIDEPEAFRLGVLAPDGSVVGDPVIRVIYRPRQGGTASLSEVAAELVNLTFDGPGAYSVVVSTEEGRVVLARPLVLHPAAG